MTKFLKKPLSILLAVLMVMSVFIAVPMSASALEIDDVQSLLSSMEAKMNDYYAQGDWDRAEALKNYYDWLDEELEYAEGQITPELENAYNESYEYFMTISGSGVSYPDVNNVYRATNGWVNVTVSDLQPGDVLVTSDTLSVRKGDCDIVLVGGTYCDEGNLSRTYPNNVTLGNNISFLFGGNYARIIDADNAKNYDPVYNNALGNAYMVIGKENGTVYLAGYYFTIYTVTWKNGDDVIKTDTVEEGATPTYDGETPTKAEDENYTYTFSGWTDGTDTYGATDTLPAVTGDITYTATYTSTRKDITGSFGSLNWCIDADGVLTFSGSGSIPMDGFNKNGDVKKVIINDSVTALGAYAFYECPNLTEVDIQNPSVSLEGTSNHFAYSSVTTVTLPEGMTTIPQDMFKACGALTTVDLPSTITRIADGAFWNSGLQSISVPEGATYDSSAFETNSLRSLTLEGSSPKTFTGGEFTFLSDAATVYIPEGSTYVYSTTTATLYVKDSSNERAQGMLEYAQYYFNDFIGEGIPPERALAYVNGMMGGDYYDVNVTTEGPFTVTLNDGDKCEAVFGNATVSTFPLNYTVTWKNDDGTTIDTTTVKYGVVPTHADPTKAEDENYTYTFSGWSPEITAVTGDITYIATYTATEKSKKLIAGHSLSLDGNIGINFYLDPSVAGLTVNEVTKDNLNYTFAWADVETTKAKVNVAEQANQKNFRVSEDGKYIIITCYVCAAEMTCGVNATFTLNGKTESESEPYTVRKYCDDSVLSENAQYKDDTKLVELVKAMLNYGAMAQTKFKVNTGYLANQNVTYEKGDVTGTMIDTAIAAANGNKTADDMNAVAAALGAKWFSTSLIYLDDSTLRHYFVKDTDAFNSSAYTGNKSNYYYYVEKTGIPAAELDNLQSFTAGNESFQYSALDFVKGMITSTADGDSKNLAKSLYWYNQAANDYFPAPAEKILVLDDVTEDTTVEDGYTITGTLKGDYKISIADGATVTLKDVEITCLSSSAQYAGITPVGDAKIVLDGTNTVKGGYEDYAGVYVPEGKTLTIDGTGSLNASSNGYGCGIGAGCNGKPAGNIVINGGTITAIGGDMSAGIGGSKKSNCGDITITGGTVYAESLGRAPGIGAGHGFYGSRCGNITISGGSVTAIGESYGSGIGTGLMGVCGAILITASVTQVTATKGSDAPNSIGAGDEGSCGTVTIEDGANVTQN